MSFQWPDFLKIASELESQSTIQGQAEARQRSAVSRAYYAAFCYARNYLRDDEGMSDLPTSGEAHVEVKNRFLSSSDQKTRSIGANLDRIRENRRKADYDDSVTGLVKMCRASLTLADDVVSTIDSKRAGF